jgi:hypothetical protein
MAIDALLKPRPFGGGNPTLWHLKYEVDDDRFLRIFKDIARVIGRSEKAYEKATEQNNPDYEEFVAEVESDYLEEIIGASFIVLQAKIRRVTSSALIFYKEMKDDHQIDIQELSSIDHIRKLGGRYKRKQASLIQLIWDVGNYYKHRDEWPVEVWREKHRGEREGSLKRDRRTRRSVQRVGIVHNSTGNMRTAYEFFGIDPYSKCEQLAGNVQEWAAQVYKTAHERLKAELDARRGTAAVTS